MKKFNPYKTYAEAAFYVIVYLAFVATVFSGLHDLNVYMKKQIFQHYGVPLNGK